MDNKQQTLTRIEQLEQELARMKESLKEKDKWEPKGGLFTVEGGRAVEAGSVDLYRKFGIEYPTYQQAEKAAKAMRTHNRLLAYVMEHAPDYKPHWEGFNVDCYEVFFNHTKREWNHTSVGNNECPGVVYMPQRVAFKLVNELNEGVVVL